MTKGFSRAGREAARGAWHMMPLMLGALPFGVLLGSVAVRHGMTPAEVALMSGLVFAGSSQFVAVDLWNAGVGGAAIAATVALVNLRHLLFGAAIAPMLPRRRVLRLAPALFLMTDEVWALATRRGPALTLPYWFGLGLPLYSAWLLSTVAGALLGPVLPNPAVWGLDFAFTAVFVALLAGFWRGGRSALPWLVSAGVATLVHHLAPGSPFAILFGGLAGAALGGLLGGVRQ